MYRIDITYDTGDSFKKELGLVHTINEVSWKSISKAKKALKDIEKHYAYYMVMNKEYDAGKEDKEKAQRSAVRSKWYSKDYPEFNLYLEGDNGERVRVHVCWTGYFESLVGGDIVEEKDRQMSFRV